MNVLKEISLERLRQQETEGFTPEHDDAEHAAADLTLAAAAYAVSAASKLCQYASETIMDLAENEMDFQDAKNYAEEGIALQELSANLWPWEDMYKPKDVRQDLIRAAALIVAQIEQIDSLTAEFQNSTEQTDE